MAWISIENLGLYNRKLRDLFKTLNIHANKIIQDSNNKFVSNDQINNWNNKLGKTENAVSASKLKNPVKINGISFDGTKDIVIDVTTTYFEEKSFKSELPANQTSIKVPIEFWEDVKNLIIVYINGIKLINEKHYTINRANYSIDLKEAFVSQADVEILFTNTKTSGEFTFELQPNQKSIQISTSKNISDNSIIHVFANGIKLIKDKHYNIEYTSKTITLIEPYQNKIDLEILIMKE